MPIASKTQRFLNFIIDMAIFQVVMMYAVRPLINNYSPGILSYENRYLQYVLNGFVIFIYYFILEATTGMTIGKLITQTKVININGLKPSTYNIFIRTFCRLIPFDAFSFLAISGWHDSLSNTTVVSTNKLN